MLLFCHLICSRITTVKEKKKSTFRIFPEGHEERGWVGLTMSSKARNEVLCLCNNTIQFSKDNSLLKTEGKKK